MFLSGNVPHPIPSGPPDGARPTEDVQSVDKSIEQSNVHDGVVLVGRDERDDEPV